MAQTRVGGARGCGQDLEPYSLMLISDRGDDMIAALTSNGYYLFVVE